MATTLIKHLLRSTENYAELIVVLHAYRYYNTSVNTDCEMLTVESMFLDLAEIQGDGRGPPTHSQCSKCGATWRA